MSQKIYTNLDIKGNATIGDITNATSDTDKFLVSDAGVVKYRTGSEMLSDLGVAPGVASNVQHQVKAGVAISKGQAVYVTSADGTNMIVGLASNASEATSSKTMGLLDNTVAINGFANVITEGLLSGLNTIGANAGDPVWLGTNGNLIYGLSNKPSAPAHLVFIGIVTRVNANNGEIFIKAQNGFELNEIHDVDLKTTSPSGNEILAFEGAPVNLWKNKTIPSVLGYTPVPTSRTITINGNTQDLSANLSFSIASGVTSFNTRTGAITLTSGDVTNALGYTPYNATNPNGYITSSGSISGNAATATNADYANSAGYAGNSNTLDGYDSSYFATASHTHIISPVAESSVSPSGISIQAGPGGGNAQGWLYPYGTKLSAITGAGRSFEIMSTTYPDGQLVLRTLGSGGTWDSWKTILDTSNYSTYAVPAARTITINGTSYDLSANRSWTVTGTETDTLATVTARGNTTSTGVGFNAYVDILNQNSVYWYNSGNGIAARTYFDGGTFNLDRSLWVTASIYGDIFYDRNNSGYYIDPASTSNLNAINFISLYSNRAGAAGPTINIDNVGSSTWPILFKTSDVGNDNESGFWTSSLGYPDMRLRKDDGTVRALISSWERSYTTYGLTDATDMRAPIFYDTDNTGYYLNPASSSYLNVLNCANVVNGAFLGVSNTSNSSGNGISLYNGGGSGQPTYGLMFAGTGTFGTHGSITSDWSTYFTMNDDSSRGWIFKRGTTNVASISGGGILQTSGYMYSSTYMQAGQSMYSPIYYDANDTSYYVDPASVSRLGKRNYLGTSSNWDLGSLNGANDYITNLHFQGHEDFWIGSGNTSWYTTATTSHHDLLINTMQSDATYTRGITFTASMGGASVYRMGRWYSSTSSASSYLNVDGSVRTPIFYDSNDTGYYVDPNGSSQMSTINAVRFASVMGSQSPDNSHPGFGIRPFYSWNIGQANNSGAGYSNGITIGSNPGDQAYGFQIVQNMWDDQLYFRRYNSGWQGWRTALDSSNYTGYRDWGGNAIYAGILYDGNNTAYYVDPNGASRMGTVNADLLRSYGNLYLDNDYGRTVVGVYSSTRYQGVFAMGDSYKLPTDGTTTGSLYGLAWSHPNAGGVAGNLNTHGLLAMENGTWLASLTGSTRARDDMRAPIFYDNNNTGYYVDPAGNSNMSAVYADNWFRARGNTGLYGQDYGIHFYPQTGSAWSITGSGGNIELQFRSNHNSTIRGYVYADTSNNIGFLTSGGGWRLRCDDSGNAIATGDVTAYSDRRVKENIHTIDNALDKVNNLRGVYYTRIDSEDKQRKVGVIAQETLEVLPEVVGQDTDGMYNVAYGNITAVLIEAIKEQQKQIEELKELVNQLIKK